MDLRKKMAFGIGKKGSAMSETQCYEKLRSLQSKGCLKILNTTYAGTKLHLPEEIDGVIPLPSRPVPWIWRGSISFQTLQGVSPSWNEKESSAFTAFENWTKPTM